MSGPITWRNVDMGNGVGEASRIIDSSSKGINLGFDKLVGVYDQYEKQQVDKNTALFQAELAKYTTPEQMQAARESGALDALQARFGLQMDQKVRNEGARNQLNNVYDDITKANKYSDTVIDRKINPQTDLSLAAKALRNSSVDQARVNVGKTESEIGLNNSNAGLNNVRAAGLTEQNRFDLFKNDEYRDAPATEQRNLERQAAILKARVASSPAAQEVLETGQSVKIGENRASIYDQGVTQRGKDANVDLANLAVSIGAGPQTPKEKQATLDRGAAEIIKKYNLPASSLQTLMTNVKIGADGVPVINARASEIAAATAITDAAAKAIESDAQSFIDAGKPYGDNPGLQALESHLDQTMSDSGWGNANKTRSKQFVNSLVNTVREVTVDGTTYKIPLTPQIILNALKSGGMETEIFGKRDIPPDILKKKIDEELAKPAVIRAFKAYQGVLSGSKENIINAYKPGK